MNEPVALAFHGAARTVTGSCMEPESVGSTSAQRTRPAFPSRPKAAHSCPRR